MSEVGASLFQKFDSWSIIKKNMFKYESSEVLFSKWKFVIMYAYVNQFDVKLCPYLFFVLGAA